MRRTPRRIGLLWIAAAIVVGGCGGVSVIESAPAGWLKFKAGAEVKCDRGLERIVEHDFDGCFIAAQYICRQLDGHMRFNVSDVATAKFIR